MMSGSGGGVGSQVLNNPFSLQSLLGGMFPNAANSGMPYYQQARGQLPQYYEPWMQQGQNAANQLNPLLAGMTQDPGGMYNQIGQSFHQSPGFQFSLNQALKAGNQQSSAGGMAGSPMNQQQNMQMATNLGNQDYYNYMQGATGMFNQGLAGLGNEMNMGANAGIGLGNNLASLLQSQGNMAYAGQANQNQMNGGMFGNLLGFGGMMMGG